MSVMGSFPRAHMMAAAGCVGLQLAPLFEVIAIAEVFRN
jgi:hypothetical protein